MCQGSTGIGENAPSTPPGFKLRHYRLRRDRRRAVRAVDHVDAESGVLRYWRPGGQTSRSRVLCPALSCSTTSPWDSSARGSAGGFSCSRPCVHRGLRSPNRPNRPTDRVLNSGRPIHERGRHAPETTGPIRPVPRASSLTGGARGRTAPNTAERRLDRPETGQPASFDSGRIRPRAARAHRGRRPAGPRARRGVARGPAVVDRELRDRRHDAGPGAVADRAAVGAAGAGAGRARPRDGRFRGVSRRLPADQGPHPPLSRRAHVARHDVDRRGLRRRWRARGRLPRAGSHRRAAAAAGGPVSHPLLRRAGRRRQDNAGEGDRRGARPAVRERAAGGCVGRGARARAAAELPRPRTGTDRPEAGRSGGQETRW